MSLIYGLNEFKAKIKSCDDSSSIRVVYEVITDQVASMKKSIADDKAWLEDLRNKIEENETRLKSVDLDYYKAAMADRLREIIGK